MRTVTAFALLTAALQGCTQTPLLQASPVALQNIVHEIASAFSACDLDLLMHSYSPSVEFISPSTPNAIVGLQAVRDHLAGAFTASFRPIMKVGEQRVRMLSPESAVITGTYTIGRTDQPNDKSWPAFFVFTLQRTDQRWLVNTQASVPMPQP